VLCLKRDSSIAPTALKSGAARLYVASEWRVGLKGCARSRHTLDKSGIRSRLAFGGPYNHLPHAHRGTESRTRNRWVTDVPRRRIHSQAQTTSRGGWSGKWFAVLLAITKSKEEFVATQKSNNAEGAPGSSLEPGSWGESFPSFSPLPSLGIPPKCRGNPKWVPRS